MLVFFFNSSLPLNHTHIDSNIFLNLEKSTNTNNEFWFFKGRRTEDPNYVSNEALRGMCENVMHLLTTTVDKMENVSKFQILFLEHANYTCLTNNNVIQILFF